MARSRTSARPRWSAARPAALGLVLLLSATGCTTGEFLRQGMPEPASREGEHILSLWQGSWIAAWAVGVLVWGLIIWSIIFHRKRSNRLPPQVRYNLPIEVLYTVVPFIMVAVLFYFSVQTENTVNDLNKPEDLVVNVTGFQWSWKFEYPQSGVTVIGERVGAVGENPTLVVPEGKRVRFNLRSADVVHSFWIPAFLFKRDLIPGHPNAAEITPQEQGTYAGRCSELCGTYHSRMLFTLKVVSPQEFQRFIERQQAETPGGPVAGSTK